MLGAVLKQVVSGLGKLPEEIAQAYEGQKQIIGGRAPQLADIVKMLQNTVSMKRTFICIDALDECVVRYRVKILASLDQILRSSPGTRMFVTGRPHIEAEVGKRLSGRGTVIRITPRRHDILSYLHRRLEEDPMPEAMDDNLKADILNKICKDVSEMFLLVSLNVDTILQGATVRSRRKKLDEMTDNWGLESAYVPR